MTIEALSPEQRAAVLEEILTRGKVRQIMNPFGMGALIVHEFVDLPEIKTVRSPPLNITFYRVDGRDESFQTLYAACRYVVERDVG